MTSEGARRRIEEIFIIMKNQNRKSKKKQQAQKQQAQVVHLPITGDDGWSLGMNDASRRYDLRHNGELVLSHVSHASCLHKAQKFDVQWEI